MTTAGRIAGGMSTSVATKGRERSNRVAEGDGFFSPSPSAGGSTWDAIVATRTRFASRGSSIDRANPRGLTSRGRRGRGERESRGDARLRRALRAEAFSRGKRKVQAGAHTAKGKRRWWCGFSRWDRAGARTYPLPEAPASRLIPLNRSRTCAHAWVSAPCAAFAPRDRSPATRTRGLREDSALGARRARCNPGEITPAETRVARETRPPRSRSAPLRLSRRALRPRSSPFPRAKGRARPASGARGAAEVATRENSHRSTEGSPPPVTTERTLFAQKLTANSP